jgi:hypothetical protein
MPNHISQFARCSLVLLIAVCATSSRLESQDAKTSDHSLSLGAALVLTPEFCATKSKKGTWMINQETFPVGKSACKELEPIMKTAFSSLKRVDDVSGVGDAQLILTPKFVDVGATQKAFAFSSRELTVIIEWTARDKTGKTVWIETIQGSAKRHQGNMFTAGSNLKHIVTDSVKDVAEQAVTKIEASPEIAKLATQGNPAQ